MTEAASRRHHTMPACTYALPVQCHYPHPNAAPTIALVDAVCSAVSTIGVENGEWRGPVARPGRRHHSGRQGIAAPWVRNSEWREPFVKSNSSQAGDPVCVGARHACGQGLKVTYLRPWPRASRVPMRRQELEEAQRWKAREPAVASPFINIAVILSTTATHPTLGSTAGPAAPAPAGRALCSPPPRGPPPWTPLPRARWHRGCCAAAAGCAAWARRRPRGSRRRPRVRRTTPRWRRRRRRAGVPQPAGGGPLPCMWGVLLGGRRSREATGQGAAGTEGGGGKGAGGGREEGMVGAPPGRWGRGGSGAAERG